MTPLLHTARLQLAPISASDQGFIFEGLSHPRVIPYYGVSYASYEATATQMDWYRKLEGEDSGRAWKLLNGEGERLGVICVYNHHREHRKAEVGFWLLPQYWGNGFCSEALVEVMRYWREERSLLRMEAFVEDANSGSARLLEQCGFQHEGTMRCCERKGDRWINLQVWAHLFEPCETA